MGRKLTSKYSSLGNRVVEEGMIGFSNKLAEEKIKMKMETDGLNFDLDDEEIKQFRNSIYNFNRMGASKVQVRAKIYNRDMGMGSTGLTTERFDEAQKRYNENLGRVEEYLNQSSDKIVSRQMTKKIAESGKI